jgi:O-Antigen ligase
VGLKYRTPSIPASAYAAEGLYALRRRGGLNVSQAARTALVRFAVPLSIVCALAAGWYHASHETLVTLPVVVALALLLATNVQFALIFVVFGGLLVFQSSDELTATKLVYLLGVGAAGAGAFIRVAKMGRERAFRDALPFLQASIAFVVLLTASLILSFANSTPQKPWLRDVAPYVLFAVAPLFAVDAATALRQQTLRRILVVAGLAGSLAFSAEWLSNRAIIDLSSVAGLPTMMLGAALFSYAMAVLLTADRGRTIWLAIAAAVFFSYAITGTRSSLFLLAAPVAILFGARRGLARRSGRLLLAVPVIALLVVAGALSFVERTGADREVLESRVELLLSTGDTSDQSLVSRRVQGDVAWSAFADDPVFGIGAGETFEWRDDVGKIVHSADIDSPLGYLAKFGLIGLAPLALLAWACVQFLRRSPAETDGTSVARFAFIGFGGVFASWWVLGVPFADKGLATGYLLLLALVLNESARSPHRVRADIGA